MTTKPAGKPARPDSAPAHLDLAARRAARAAEREANPEYRRFTLTIDETTTIEAVDELPADFLEHIVRDRWREALDLIFPTFDFVGSPAKPGGDAPDWSFDDVIEVAEAVAEWFGVNLGKRSASGTSSSTRSSR